MVIFGAAGDLTKRKLIPALYNVAKGNLLSREFAVIGVAAADLSEETFRSRCGADMAEYATGDVDPRSGGWLERHLHYVRAHSRIPKPTSRLRRCLEEVDRRPTARVGNVVFYLATAPGAFGEIVCNLGEAGLAQERDAPLSARDRRETFRARSGFGA